MLIKKIVAYALLCFFTTISTANASPITLTFSVEINSLQILGPAPASPVPINPIVGQTVTFQFDPAIHAVGYTEFPLNSVQNSLTDYFGLSTGQGFSPFGTAFIGTNPYPTNTISDQLIRDTLQSTAIGGPVIMWSDPQRKVSFSRDQYAYSSSLGQAPFWAYNLKVSAAKNEPGLDLANIRNLSLTSDAFVDYLVDAQTTGVSFGYSEGYEYVSRGPFADYGQYYYGTAKLVGIQGARLFDVPEPSSLLLIAIALAGLSFTRFRNGNLLRSSLAIRSFSLH